MKKSKKNRTKKIRASQLNKPEFKSYDEYFKYINDVAISKSLEDMMPVPSMKEAEQAGEMIIEAITESVAGGFQPNRDKPSYALIQAKKKDKNYLVYAYQLNEALIVMRATDLDTKQVYLPTQVWAAMTNAETDESDVVRVLSMGMREE